MPMKKSAIEKLLREPNIAVVAVTAPNGAPHAVPTWYEYRGGEVIFHTGPEAFKYKCLAHNPRITLVVDTRKSPYKCVILKGSVTMKEGPTTIASNGWRSPISARKTARPTRRRSRASIWLSCASSRTTPYRGTMLKNAPEWGFSLHPFVPTFVLR